MLEDLVELPWLVYRNLDTQIGGVRVKIGECILGGWYISNVAVASRFVKLYNQETVPASTDTPKITLVIPPLSAANLLCEKGIDFEKGLGIRATTVLADSDATAPTANDVVVNLFYR